MTAGIVLRVNEFASSNRARPPTMRIADTRAAQRGAGEYTLRNSGVRALAMPSFREAPTVPAEDAGVKEHSCTTWPHDTVGAMTSPAGQGKVGPNRISGLCGYTPLQVSVQYSSTLQTLE